MAASKRWAPLLLCWAVTGSVVRVIDGDSVVLSLRLWHNSLTVTEHVRLLGVDAPELHGGTPDTQAAAVDAKHFTEAWMARGPVTVTTCKRDSFGRVLGMVTRDGENLSEALIRAGHGTWRRP